MKKVLGRGLSSLIPDSYINQAKADQPSPFGETHKPQPADSQNAFQLLSTEKIIPNKEQPRKDFSPEGIEELAASIKEKGILQPIIVSKSQNNQYMVICGERRFRAAQMCGLTHVPVIIKEIAPADFLEWALIENIQREDLNPMEEAQAYDRLINEQMLSQDELAKRLGKNRSTIANTIRLLRLPEELHSLIVSGRLSAGHARALLGLLTPEHQRQLAKRILEDNLSVRQVEAIVNRSNAHKRKAKSARHLSPEIIDLEGRLSRHLGTQVKIYPRKKKDQGRLEIHYYSLDDLDRILETFQIQRD
ncbi:MAG: ParB/RepB/Spo0J family partition protein [Candidatus Omnitrophica bacterium]|nr:ParB/RepB/Spo0J family partition protein [Candidatus Omnitrophota bacterium]